MPPTDTDTDAGDEIDISGAIDRIVRHRLRNKHCPECNETELGYHKGVAYCEACGVELARKPEATSHDASVETTPCRECGETETRLVIGTRLQCAGCGAYRADVDPNEVLE